MVVRFCFAIEAYLRMPQSWYDKKKELGWQPQLYFNVSHFRPNNVIENLVWTFCDDDLKIVFFPSLNIDLSWHE